MVIHPTLAVSMVALDNNLQYKMDNAENKHAVSFHSTQRGFRLIQLQQLIVYIKISCYAPGQLNLRKPSGLPLLEISSAKPVCLYTGIHHFIFLVKWGVLYQR